jgi:hypothetical protein
MRKHLIWVLALGVAAASVSFASAAVNNQQIVGSVAPKKLPKKGKKAPVSLDVNVFATHPSGSDTSADLPHPTTNAKVDFDKDLSFQQKGYPTCDANQFGASTKTDDVKQACPDSILGSGSATVKVPTGPASPPLEVKADVIAANVAGNKILLHSYNPLSGGQPLVGQLSKTSGKYGTLLNVEVPPLAGGTAVITQFQTKIKKVTYKHKGKKLAIISSTCKDKKIEFQARFTDNLGQLATGTDSFPCKQKRKK